jgi:hypothetical protein
MKRALLLVAIVVCVTACEPPMPVAVPSASPTPTPTASGITVTFTAEPAPVSTPTCGVLPTPNYGPEPSHAAVNGQPTLSEPIMRGVILVKIQQCRDIQAVLQKYGLPGPATRYIDVPVAADTIADGSARWFRVAVAPGMESATVVELYRHPEDIEYVQLLPEFTGGAARA